jgi:hypothetical protein
MDGIRLAVARFLEEYWGPLDRFSLTDDFDLFGQLGIDGDDASELMDRFATRFGADMTGYRWYFHHGEEGINLAGVFFPPPNARVTHMPLTFGMLVKAAEAKSWSVEYPSHRLPTVRRDLQLNFGCVAVFVGVAVIQLVVWLWSSAS